MMADIPEGADQAVAYAAIAWEIVKRAFGNVDYENYKTDDFIDEFTRLFRKTLNQLYHEPEGNGR